MKFRQKLGFFVVDIFETIAVAVSLFVIIYIFIAQVHKVDGPSMQANFFTGDYILTNKVTYHFELPKRGDVVVFKYPKDERVDYIKRVIALPNESVKVENGEVYIYNDNFPDGFVLKETYLKENMITNPSRFLTDGKVHTVSEDSIMAFGDNRPESSDSRDFGEVPLKNIVGKGLVVYWPVSRMKIIEHHIFDEDK